MNKRIPRNQGRIEFISCYDYISKMIEKGYDKKKIHQILIDDGKITMSYSTFCYQYAHKIKSNIKQDKIKTITYKSNEFPNPKNMKPNELF